MPIPDPVVEARRRPVVLAGDVPSPPRRPRAAAFTPAARPRKEGLCDVDDPVLREAEPGHWAACHLVTEGSYPNIRSADRMAGEASAAPSAAPDGEAL